MDDIINIKNFDPNRIKIDKKSYKNIVIYYIGCNTTKNLRYVKINSVNPLYLVINKINGYIEGSNGNRYLTLTITDKNRDTFKKYTELCDKIKDLIRSITNTSGDYDKQYMKVKFNSDDNLPLNKILMLHSLIIVVRSIFQEDKKYYTQVFLDEGLYEL